MKYVNYLFLFIIIFTACQSDNAVQNTLFIKKNGTQLGIDFSNDLPLNIDLNIFNYMYYYNGGGLACGDLNNDGLPDLIFSSNLGAEQIYLNKGNLKFENITAQTGIDGGENVWTTGVSLVDINNDGYLDVYLSQVGAYRNLDGTNKLFVYEKLNDNQVPTYKQKSAAYGLDFKGLSTQAGFLDMDLDGDLDMYLMNHSLHHNGTFGQRKSFLGKIDSISGDKIYENKNGTYTDVTAQTGINSNVLGYGLGLSFGDVNLDGLPDIYVGNDFHENDYLYINRGDMKFTDELPTQMPYTSRFTMGVDIADVNNDLLPDIMSLDMLPEDPEILKRSEGEDDTFEFKLGYGYHKQYPRNHLQINQKYNHFIDIGRYANVHATDWSWSAIFADFDQNGRKDLFVSNGIPRRMNDLDYIDFMSGNDLKYKIQFDHIKQDELSFIDKIPEIKIRNKFFLQGENLMFDDAEKRIANDEISYSNSAIVADLDNDGDLDIVTNNIDQTPFIYVNQSAEKSNKSFTQITLNGSPKNRHGIGTNILLYKNNEVQSHYFSPLRGFQASCHVPHPIIEPELLDSLVVVWFDGKFEVKTNIPTGKLALNYNDAKGKFNWLKQLNNNELAIEEVQEKFGLNSVHTENPFVEFNREVLIPHSNSSEGPALAIGDLNGDGRDDIFVGGAKLEHPEIWYQRENGFEKAQNLALLRDSIPENTRAHIADFNADGINDLLVANGGNEFRLNSIHNQPRLYLGQKNGDLVEEVSAFEGIRLTCGAVAVLDVNEDNLPDVFFGARAQPWAYGENPQSYFAVNQGNGQFLIQNNYLPNAGKVGLVKDARLSNLDGLGKHILIAVEWSTPRALLLDAEEPFERPLDYDKGWWNFLHPVDLDGDGTQEIIAGNLGWNSRLKASDNQPFKMCYEDLDGNGKREQLLTYFVKNKEIPFHSKKELQQQMPLIKKKFVYAKDFSEADINDIFPKKKMKNCMTVNTFANSIYWNQGGDYVREDLPARAQWTSLYAAHTIQLNGKNHVILMGNYDDANVQMGAYNGERALLLSSDKDRKLSIKPLQNFPHVSQVKDIQSIQIQENKYLVIAQNNDTLKLIKVTENNVHLSNKN